MAYTCNSGILSLGTNIYSQRPCFKEQNNKKNIMKMVAELLKEVINVASKSFLSTILLEEINLLDTSVRWLVDFFISGEREHCVSGGQQFIPQLRGREAQPTEKLIKLESADLSHPWERMDCHINVCCLQPRCKSQRHLNYKQLSKFISII